MIMWICLNDAFLSVVQPRQFDVPAAERRTYGKHAHRKLLMVRARKPGHLDALLDKLRLKATVYRWKNRDYPARVFIPRELLADFLAKQVADIRYTNFKDSVRDNELHDAFMGVWSVMNRYGNGGFRQRRRENFGQSAFAYDHQEPWDRDEVPEEWFAGARLRLPDDDTCGKLGCTPEHPCRECITHAMRNTRYGDFDEREDEEAGSHLRIPPR